MAAVGMQLAREDAGRVARLEHDRAGAVAEQHARGAILEVEDAREHLGADDERLARGARADHRVGHREGIHEARAHGLHVERGAAVHAELLLHQAGRGREHHVGRRRGHHDEVDRRRVQPGGKQGAAGRLDREVAGADVRLGEVARADAGALDDPLVGRLDALGRELSGQLVVGESLGRQEAAGAGDARVACGHGSQAVGAAAADGAGACGAGAAGIAVSVSRIRSWTRTSSPWRAAS